MEKFWVDHSWGAFSFLCGALIMHLWNRFRNRLKRLRYTVEYTRLAVSSQNPAWGNIQVLHNNFPVKNLHFGLVELQNESTSDLQDVRVDIATVDGGEILISNGSIEGVLQQISFTDSFKGLMEKVIAKTATQDEQGFFIRRREYVIPVFNRGAVTRFFTLMTRPDEKKPTLKISINHPGTVLIHQSRIGLLWGVPKDTALQVGIFLGVLLISPILKMGSSHSIVTFFGWVTGLCVLPIGVIAIKAWRFLLKVLS